LSEAGDTNLDDAGRRVLVDIRRHWLIVVLVTVVVVAAAGVSLARRSPSYKASATILVAPLPQFDETFLGTGLIRDAGDASLTASTVAQLLSSPAIARETANRLGAGWTAASVVSAIDVKPISNTDVIAIDARAGGREQALALATAYAKAALRVHWQSLVRQLDERIRILVTVSRSAGGNSDLVHDLAIVRALRRGGFDPTLTFRYSKAEGRAGASVGTIVFLALVGGLILGALGALGIERVRPSRRRREASESTVVGDEVVARHGEGEAGARARQ
jgi:capsular polysaccharide biosynthesis protein